MAHAFSKDRFLTKTKIRITDVLCVTSLLVSIAVVSVALHARGILNPIIGHVLLIAHMTHVMILLAFFVCIRLEAARSHGMLRSEIKTVVAREHLKIRRVLHDLKQPAALIMCAAEEEPMDRPLVTALCLQLSTRIQGVNEMPTGVTVKPYVVVSIHDLLAHLASVYRRLFTARGVELVFRSEVPQHVMVFALPDGINRAVENLLSNSNKFVSNKGVVVLSLWTTPTFVCISVKDTGKGIKPHLMDAIWTDKYKGQEDSFGSGLGLAAVKDFALEEGGSVWAEANDGHGVTIGLSLLCPSADDTVVGLQDSRVSSSLTTSQDESPLDELHLDELPLDEIRVEGGPKYVLVVEDDALQLRINVKKLQRAVGPAVRIETAIEGNSGLVKMRARMYDALISDHNMPVMDGANMIKFAREEGVLPRIVKLLSAQTLPSEYFESFGIAAEQIYDKTTMGSSVFSDVACELVTVI
jgi:CheY-like chemotaxis protein